jgi:probable phosphoglycerate mutase
MVLDDLTEIHLGDWQGLHMDEIKQRWPELWYQSRIDPSEITMPNGESLHQVTERALRAFQAVLATDHSKQAIMVTHDAVVRVIVAHVLGAPNSIYRNFEINNASLTQIRITNGKARLTTLNDTAHLQT